MAEHTHKTTPIEVNGEYYGEWCETCYEYIRRPSQAMNQPQSDTDGRVSIRRSGGYMVSPDLLEQLKNDFELLGFPVKKPGVLRRLWRKVGGR